MKEIDIQESKTMLINSELQCLKSEMTWINSKWQCRRNDNIVQVMSNERHKYPNLIILHFRVTDPKAKKTYYVRVAFQVWLKPGSYKVGPQSVGANEQIDPKFVNTELEWSTKERGSIMLQSLLLKVESLWFFKRTIYIITCTCMSAGIWNLKFLEMVHHWSGEIWAVSRKNRPYGNFDKNFFFFYFLSLHSCKINLWDFM